MAIMLPDHPNRFSIIGMQAVGYRKDRLYEIGQTDRFWGHHSLGIRLSRRVERDSGLWCR